MLSEYLRPCFAKLGPAGKNGPVSLFFHFFHSESIKMNEKQYNDPI